MHTRFAATVDFQGLGMEDAARGLDVPEELRAVLPRAPGKIPTPLAGTASKTDFLGLDKVGSPTFQWLEVRDLDHPPHADNAPYLENTGEEKFGLHYDEE